jgi:hypothetical protein
LRQHVKFFKLLKVSGVNKLQMTHQITITDNTFRRVRSLITPLFDENAVVERLLDYWEAGHSTANTQTLGLPDEHEDFVLSRGERLRVGLQLRAHYRGRCWRGEVTEEGISFDGEKFSSPSAAARYVKRKSGATSTAAHTNGWRFWEAQDPRSGNWHPLESLRKQVTSAASSENFANRRT